MKHVIVLSARSLDGLDRTAARLARALSPSVSLDDVAATLATGRESFPVRAAWLAEDVGGLAASLGAGKPDSQGRVSGRVRAVFAVHARPSVTPAMAAALAESDATVAAWLDRDAPLGTVLQFAVYQRLRELGVALEPVAATAGAGPLVEAMAGRLDFETMLRASADLGDLGDSEVSGHRGTVTTVRVALAPPDGRADVDLAAPGLLPAAVAALWCHGVTVDTTLGRPGRRIHLPGTAFERRSGADTALPDGVVSGRPLTALEQRLLYQDLVRTSSSAEHNVTASVTLPSPVDVAVLDAHLRDLQREHPALRTVYSRVADRWLACELAEPALSVDTLVDDDAVRAVAGESLEFVDTVAARAVRGPGTLALVAHRALLDADELREILDALVERATR